MDFLTSKRFVTTALVLLGILNVTLLGVLSWQNFLSRNFRSIEVREYYSRNTSPDPEMSFSPQQLKQFQNIRREHFRNSRPEIQKIVNLKKELIDEAVKPSPDTLKIGMIADRIGKQQAKLERGLALHFNELSSLCTPAQRDSLKAFLGHVYSRRFERGARWTREIRPVDEPGPHHHGPPQPQDRPLP
jgi:hypothetical protein